MRTRHFFRLQISLVASLMLALTLPTSAPAQVESPIDLLEERAVFDPLPGEGEPVDSAGGASRGCPLDPEQAAYLTALIPRLARSDDPLADFKGLTVASHPTFYFYVPQASDESIEAARFGLKDENDRDIYLTTFSIESTPGIVSITLPEDAPALEVDERYRWYFSIVCQPSTPEDFPESISINGEIGRIELDPALTDELETVASLERAILYARNGVWFDALKHLVDLKRAQPENPTIVANWDALLNSVSLEEIAREPLLDCCHLEPSHSSEESTP